MLINDFKASLFDGTLNLDEVKEHLATLETPEPAPSVEPEAITALRNELETLRNEFQTRITALGSEPGAGRSTPPMPSGDAPGATESTAEAKLIEFNNTLVSAAEKNETVTFEIGG